MGSEADNLGFDYRRRLLAPDFEGFEAFYGCAVPLELRQFYDLKEQLLAGVLYATCRTNQGFARYSFIQYAEPMDRLNWSDRYGREFFQFATDTDGYPLLIKPELKESPVFVDQEDWRLIPRIEDCDFSLKEVVGTLSCNP